MTPMLYGERINTAWAQRGVSVVQSESSLLVMQDEHDSLQRSSAESEQQYNTAASTAVVGLSNLGNTCFFNSSVQLLLACSPLQQLLSQPDHCLSKGPLGFALQQTARYASGKLQLDVVPLHQLLTLSFISADSVRAVAAAAVAVDDSF